MPRPRAALPLLLATLAACGARVPLDPLPPGIPGGVATTIFLVGDAGDVGPGHPVMEQLARDVRASAGDVVVAYLGDNVYPAGVRPEEPEHTRDTLRLATEVSVIAGTGATALFVPGNHDWHGRGQRGLEAVRAQQAYLLEAARRGAAVRSLPRAGCPGPDTLDLPEVRLVVLDTQWLLQTEGRGGAVECGLGAEDRLGPSITRAIDGAGGREVVVLSHHPLRTEGPHGGYFPPSRHLFPALDVAPWAYLPLPVVGSLYVLARSHGMMTRQDLASAPNRAMRALLQGAFAAAAEPPLIHAAGHDHSLQVLAGGPGGPTYELVSGAASKSTPLGEGDDTIFGASAPGYMRLELTRSALRLTVVPLAEDPSARTAWCRVIDRSTRAMRPCS